MKSLPSQSKMRRKNQGAETRTIVSAYGKNGTSADAKKNLARAAQMRLEVWGGQSEEERPAFQVLDFFSGAGGMSAGFVSLSKVVGGIRIVGGCDINPDAAKTFEKNFGAPCIVQDINTLKNKRKLSNFLGALPEFDAKRPLIVIGCAPCQGFSSHRKKSWDEEDERNDLVSTFASVATSLSPECIVMENVPELLSKKYWNYYQRAKKIFEKAGYTVRQRVYNTAGFGVPQERFRALVIAMKKPFSMPEPVLSDDEYLTVRDAIGFLPRVEAGELCADDAYHFSAKHKPATIEILKKIPKDGGNRPPGVGPKCLDKVKGYYDVYGRLWWDRPSITVTQYARNPASGRYTHPEQDRGLTIREASLLQSFPKGFQFTGSFDSMFKQIGEAVPPKFACAVAANVLVELLAPEQNKIMVESGKDVEQPLPSSYSGVIARIKAARRNKIHVN